MKYLIEYDVKCNTYKIYDMKNKSEGECPTCIGKFFGETVDTIIDLCLFGFETEKDK